MNQRVNEYNQPIGKEILNWQKREFPGNINLEGKYTIITRLSRDHLKDLYSVFKDTNPSSWTYLSDEAPENYEQFEQILINKIENPASVFYAVISKDTRKPLGYFSLMRIDQNNGVIEVGNVNFSDSLKGTKMSTEAHYLLAKYVFEDLGYRRYEWKCDSLNAPSFRAAKRLGFTYEGTFRNAVIYKNRSRDTSWLSMIEGEWPKIKEAFIQWLSEDNFDENGIQIRKLESFRK